MSDENTTRAVSLDGASRAMRVGMRVELRALQSKPHLNGQRGRIVSYEAEKQRWGVKVDSVEQTMSLKTVNLCALGSGKSGSGTKRLCRYGEKCYRPDCHFHHVDATGRCKHFADAWQDLLRRCADVETSVDTPPSSHINLGSVITTLREDLACQKEQLTKSCADIQMLQSDLKLRNDTAVDIGASEVASKVDQIEADLGELTDLSAFKHVQLQSELDVKVKDLEVRLSEYTQQVKNVEMVQTHKSDCIDDDRIKLLVNTELQKLLMPTMQAAFTPLVTSITTRMLEFEQRIMRMEDT